MSCFATISSSREDSDDSSKSRGLAALRRGGAEDLPIVYDFGAPFFPVGRRLMDCGILTQR
jgi:hypothetical protein